MPLDTAVQGIAEALGAMTPFSEMTTAEVRGAVDSFKGLQKPHREVARVIEETYQGPEGNQPLRIYVPTTGTDLPVVVYFHGGGFIAGNISVSEEPNRALAADTGAIVVAASYRLAPEHPFPAATDDTFAALQWVAANIATYGGDPTRIAVMGDSAGGNLAAVAAQRARDEGGPALVGQVLVYPVIDSEAQLPSRSEFGSGYIISAADLDSFWGGYLGSPEDAANPLATPSLASSLTGLPPALVLSTECEVARDEIEAYGKQLAAAGVETEAIRFDGLAHGVYWMSGAVPRSQELHDAIVSFLKHRFDN
jgi:acetyl esterase